MYMQGKKDKSDYKKITQKKNYISGEYSKSEIVKL